MLKRLRKHFSDASLMATVASSLALGLGVAWAHETSHPSSVSMAPADGVVGTVWLGNVSSPKGKCEPRRTVKVFRAESSGGGGVSHLIGEDKTDASGAYEVLQLGSPPAGYYYAKVLRKNIGRSGHRHICNAARSPEFEVADS